jgi:hypothetical protein
MIKNDAAPGFEQVVDLVLEHVKILALCPGAEVCA